jgi:hypothetical protein
VVKRRLKRSLETSAAIQKPQQNSHVDIHVVEKVLMVAKRRLKRVHQRDSHVENPVVEVVLVVGGVSHVLPVVTAVKDLAMVQLMDPRIDTDPDLVVTIRAIGKNVDVDENLATDQ